jgi:hypothetical protein
MGYDCTLHAVDERQIGPEFEKLLLERGSEADSTDEDEEQDLSGQILTSLAEETPAESTSLICQMALVIASKTHPYHYERGFALCLWPELPDGLDARLPQELTGSPETLFGSVMEKYPQLRGRFPKKFSGNLSTGTFIPAKNVPATLEWIEKKVAKFAEGDRGIFRGLLLVLQYCARHHLAYWEGTDLPVPMAKISPEGAEERRANRCFQWPDPGYEPIARLGNLFVCEYVLGPNDDARTALADFSVWPPSVQWLPEYATNAAFSPAGKLVTVAAEPGKYFYTVRLRNSAKSEAEIQELDIADTSSVGENGYDWCGFLGEQVVSMLKFQKGKTPERRPLFQQGNLLVEDKTFRAAKDRHTNRSRLASLFHKGYGSGREFIRAGLARTGSGAEVFIWGEHGHERSEHGFRKTFDLGAEASGSGEWSTAPAGADGFFYVNRSSTPMDTDKPSLYEIERGAAPVPHLPKLTNIMEVHRGPDGSLLLREGMSKSGDWGKLYWPQTREVVGLKPNLLPDVDPDDVHALDWLDEKRMLLVFTAKEVWPVAWADIETLAKKKVR